MRKITSVRLKNFQSHEDTHISFDDYNVIYGSTNSGKSAIIRGIKWVLYNLPPAEGVDFRRFGTKETLVTIEFNDGRKITRRRTAKENEYILEDADGTKTSYAQFGRGPLKEVMDFHGMYQVNLFGNPQSVNIVDQSEPPFFLSQGPTARGHLISRLAGTLLYESALKLMNRGVSEYSRKIEEQTDTLEALNRTIESLGYIPDLKDFLEYAEKVDDAVSKDTAKRDQINSLLIRIGNSAETRESNIKKATYVEKFNEAQDTVNTVREDSQNIARINNYRDALSQHFELWNAQRQYPFSQPDIEKVQNDLASIMAELAKTLDLSAKRENISACYKKLKEAKKRLAIKEKYENKASDMINKLSQCNDNLSDLSSRYWNVYTQRHRILDKRAEINDINSGVECAMQNYKEALLEAKVCPTCSQTIDASVLRRLKI